MTRSRPAATTARTSKSVRTLTYRDANVALLRVSALAMGPSVRADELSADVR